MGEVNDVQVINNDGMPFFEHQLAQSRINPLKDKDRVDEMKATDHSDVLCDSETSVFEGGDSDDSATDSEDDIIIPPPEECQGLLPGMIVFIDVKGDIVPVPPAVSQDLDQDPPTLRIVRLVRRLKSPPPPLSATSPIPITASTFSPGSSPGGSPSWPLTQAAPGQMPQIHSSDSSIGDVGEVSLTLSSLTPLTPCGSTLGDANDELGSNVIPSPRRVVTLDHDYPVLKDVVQVVDEESNASPKSVVILDLDHPMLDVGGELEVGYGSSFEDILKASSGSEQSKDEGVGNEQAHGTTGLPTELLRGDQGVDGDDGEHVVKGERLLCSGGAVDVGQVRQHVEDGPSKVTASSSVNCHVDSVTLLDPPQQSSEEGIDFGPLCKQCETFHGTQRNPNNDDEKNWCVLSNSQVQHISSESSKEGNCPDESPCLKGDVHELQSKSMDLFEDEYESVFIRSQSRGSPMLASNKTSLKKKTRSLKEDRDDILELSNSFENVKVSEGSEDLMRKVTSGVFNSSLNHSQFHTRTNPTSDLEHQNSVALQDSADVLSQTFLEINPQAFSKKEILGVEQTNLETDLRKYNSEQKRSIVDEKDWIVDLEAEALERFPNYKASFDEHPPDILLQDDEENTDLDFKKLSSSTPIAKDQNNLEITREKSLELTCSSCSSTSPYRDLDALYLTQSAPLKRKCKRVNNQPSAKRSKRNWEQWFGQFRTMLDSGRQKLMAKNATSAHGSRSCNNFSDNKENIQASSCCSNSPLSSSTQKSAAKIAFMETSPKHSSEEKLEEALDFFESDDQKNDCEPPELSLSANDDNHKDQKVPVQESQQVEKSYSRIPKSLVKQHSLFKWSSATNETKNALSPDDADDWPSPQQNPYYVERRPAIRVGLSKRARPKPLHVRRLWWVSSISSFEDFSIGGGEP